LINDTSIKALSKCGLLNPKSKSIASSTKKDSIKPDGESLQSQRKEYDVTPDASKVNEITGNSSNMMNFTNVSTFEMELMSFKNNIEVMNQMNGNQFYNNR
jgi:hypothetical protein